MSGLTHRMSMGFFLSLPALLTATLGPFASPCNCLTLLPSLVLAFGSAGLVLFLPPPGCTFGLAGGGGAPLPGLAFPAGGFAGGGSAALLFFSPHLPGFSTSLPLPDLALSA